MSRARTWLQLLRPPNLFTVPGDPLTGYLLANGWEIDYTLPLAMVASLCLYSAGLLMNDLADEVEDLRERPSRPLPSGAATRRNVWFVTALLAFAGLSALAACGRPAAVLLGGALLAAIALYNWVTKGWPVIGALNMGLCRSLSVLLGAFVGFRADWQTGLYAALPFGLYIAAVTNLARHETRPRTPIFARLLPAVVALFAAGFGIVNASYSPEKAYAIPLFALTAAVVLWLAIRMFRTAAPLPPLIGAHIRALLLFQAATSYLAEPIDYGKIAAIALLALWPISRWVGRWFYAS